MITTRAGKGAPLTHAELDTNFNELSSGKVDKSGSTMTGPLILPGNPETNLAAAPKQYVDSSSASVVASLLASIGSCNPGTEFPTGLQPGALCFRTDESKLYQMTSAEPVWKLLLDLTGPSAAVPRMVFEGVVGRGADAQGGKVQLEKPNTGSAMAGNLAIDIAGDRLRFYDASTGNGFHIDLTLGQAAQARKIWHSGNQGHGSGLDADTVDGIQGSEILLKAGGTMSGPLQLANHPSASLHAASKSYVDDPLFTSGIFGPPLWIWDGYSKNIADSGIIPRHEKVGTALADFTTYNATTWGYRYMFRIYSMTQGFALPVNYVRFELPIDPTTHNAYFICGRSRDTWTSPNVWVCHPTTGKPMVRLQQRQNASANNSAGNTVFIGPQGQAAMMNSYHEWLMFGVPKSFIDQYKTASDTLRLAVVHGSSTEMWISGMAMCANPYGVTNLDMPTASNAAAVHGGATIPGYGDWNHMYMGQIAANTTIAGVRIPLCSMTDAILFGLYTYNDVGISQPPVLYVNGKEFILSPHVTGRYGRNQNQGTYKARLFSAIVPAADVTAAAIVTTTGSLMLPVTLANLADISYPRGIFTELVK